MANKLIKLAIKLTNKNLMKSLKETNNKEIISDGFYIMENILKDNIFVKVLANLIVTEKLSPEVFIRHLIACKTAVASEIYLFDFELKKIENIKLIRDFFKNLTISSALKSPVELSLQESYLQNVKVIGELKKLDLVRNERYYRLSNLMGHIFASIGTINQYQHKANYYNFGYSLSLYYLLHRESLARSAKKPSLLDRIDSKDLLITKLKIMQKWIDAISKIYPQSFNDFVLIINQTINKMQNLKG